VIAAAEDEPAWIAVSRQVSAEAGDREHGVFDGRLIGDRAFRDRPQRAELGRSQRDGGDAEVASYVEDRFGLRYNDLDGIAAALARA
jgi:hypothetical protein